METMGDQANYNGIRQVAIHEAAHFVVALLGYDYGGKVEAYQERQEYELPISVRIKEEGGGYSGSVSYQDEYESEITQNNLSNLKKSKLAVRLLAGYAAETAYGLLDIFDSKSKVILKFNNCLQDLSSPDDFCKVASIVYDIFIEDPEFSNKFDLLVWRLWESTLEIVECNVVQDAIERVADILEEDKIISHQQVIKMRKDEVEFHSIKHFLMHLPVIDP